MWSGGIVGLKSILGIKSRVQALEILDKLSDLGYLKYTLDSKIKKLTYQLTDWVVKCSGEECVNGTVYATDGFGFLCLPRNITQRLAEERYIFDEADAWLDLWCHTVSEEPGNAFSFIAPAVQYGNYGAILTMEKLGQRWGWEKTKVWRFFKKHGDIFALYRLPGSYGCLVFNKSYPMDTEVSLPEQAEFLRILDEIRIWGANTHKVDSDNEHINRLVAWYSRNPVVKRRSSRQGGNDKRRAAESDHCIRFGCLPIQKRKQACLWQFEYGGERMAEPQKQQMGDGSDNIGQAAGQAAKAAKNAGKQAAKQTAKKGAEAAANAAAATVKAGVEGGKAVAEIAAGTAAGGPWGAIISAAWAMRHTLFKILVCLCLSVVFLIVMIVELPGIIINKALGIDGNEPTVSITEIYENLSEAVSDIVQAGYDASMAEVERLISDGGYDRELSMNALINYAQSSAGYDTAYILSAYSTSVEQLSNDPEDMQKKLDGVTANMFPVTSVERENEVITPVAYYTYKPVKITVVTKTVKTGMINGVPQYRYETAEATYYLQDQQLSSNTQIEVDASSRVSMRS